MSQDVSVLATSGWEVATAIGTILGAAATAAAVVAALLIGASDRRSSERALAEQVTEQRAASRRIHELDLLLRLQEQLGRYNAHYRDHAVTNECRTNGRGILLALDDTSELAALRLVFALDHAAFEELPRAGDVYPHLTAIEDKAERVAALLVQAEVELGARIRAVGQT